MRTSLRLIPKKRSYPQQMSEERLQKIISRAGVASRRKAEQFIEEGRVSVNGQTVTELGSKADLSRDKIKVDGRILREPDHLSYIVLHKPKGCVSTVSDPERRQTVMDVLRKAGFHDKVVPVGRLDYASEGLLLLTNDGEMANRITAARNHVQKTYVVKANGALSEEQLEQFREGIYLSGRKTAPAQIKLIRRAEAPWYEVKLIEGRKQQIRDMFKHFNRLVEKLRRTKVGFLELGDLPPAKARYLHDGEVARLKKVLKMDTPDAEHK